jgi:hypothetical protein
MLLELAKELRGAGFPNIQDVQHRQGREFLASNGGVSVYSLGQIAPTEDWFIPTLSELIEACEEQFDSMYRSLDGSWLATSVTYDDGDAFGIERQKGESKDSPEEAVARLWLALKKN